MKKCRPGRRFQFRRPCARERKRTRIDRKTVKSRRPKCPFQIPILKAIVCSKSTRKKGTEHVESSKWFMIFICWREIIVKETAGLAAVCSGIRVLQKVPLSSNSESPRTLLLKMFFASGGWVFRCSPNWRASLSIRYAPHERSVNIYKAYVYCVFFILLEDLDAFRDSPAQRPVITMKLSFLNVHIFRGQYLNLDLFSNLKPILPRSSDIAILHCRLKHVNTAFTISMNLRTRFVVSFIDFSISTD